MVATMLHSVATGNILPASIPLVCVDINPATVTKLADRGSSQARGIVTDVGLFLEQLARELVPDYRRSDRRRPAPGRAGADQAGLGAEGGPDDRRHDAVARRRPGTRAAPRGRARAAGPRPRETPPPTTIRPGRRPRRGWPARCRATPRPGRTPPRATRSPSAAAAVTIGPVSRSGSPSQRSVEHRRLDARSATGRRAPARCRWQYCSQQPRPPHSHGGPSGHDLHVAELARHPVARRATPDRRAPARRRCRCPA